MSLSSNQHKAISIISFLSLLVFLRLGSGEVQPWDEGLYAIRAKSIIQYHDYFDQTQHTLGGLYSSTYPPLTVWFMSASMSVLGQDAFAIRLFSAICSVLSMMLLYLIARRMLSSNQSLMAVVLLAASLHWNNFARQGMTDIPLTMFFLLTLWAVLKLRESKENKLIIIYSLIFALSFAAALMTKIIISFLPLLFVTMLFFEPGKKKYYLSIAAILGILIALPWYLYMALHYGSAFSQALLVPHIYSVVEKNSQKFGVLYYLNQMITSNAFVLLSFIMIIISFSKKIREKIFTYNKDRFLLNTSVLWFGITFVIFSLSMTKMLHYSMYMMPPAILLAVIFYEYITDIIKNNRITMIIFSAIAVLIVWSFSFGLRQDIKGIFTGGGLSTIAMVFIAFIIAVVLFVIFIKKSLIDKYIFAVLPKLIYTLIILLIIRVVFINMYSNTGHSYGARHVGDILLEKNARSFVYLFHKATPADSLNPQLAWYTDDLMTNWDKDKTYKPIALPQADFSLADLSLINNYPDDYIVYYLPDDKNLAQLNIEQIEITRPLIETSKRYIVFGKQFSELKNIGKQI